MIRQLIYEHFVDYNRARSNFSMTY